MSIPRFCKQCGSILEIVNMDTGKMNCKSCNNSQDLEQGDRVIVITYHNKEKRTLTDIEVTRLMTEPTTKKKKIKCFNCDNNILAVMRDEEYKYILGCNKCGNTFRY